MPPKLDLRWIHVKHRGHVGATAPVHSSSLLHVLPRPSSLSTLSHNQPCTEHRVIKLRSTNTHTHTRTYTHQIVQGVRDLLEPRLVWSESSEIFSGPHSSLKGNKKNNQLSLIVFILLQNFLAEDLLLVGKRTKSKWPQEHTVTRLIFF